MDAKTLKDAADSFISLKKRSSMKWVNTFDTTKFYNVLLTGAKLGKTSVSVELEEMSHYEVAGEFDSLTMDKAYASMLLSEKLAREVAGLNVTYSPSGELTIDWGKTC